MKNIYYNGRIYENYREPFILQAYMGAYEKYLESFTSYPVSGSHDFKDGQEVVKGVDYYLEYKTEIGKDQIPVAFPITPKQSQP